MTATKPVKKARPKKKREKQGYLPGTEPPQIKVLDEAADIYFEAMRDRVKLSKKEDEAKDNLIDKMKEHGLTVYETPDGLRVEVLNKSNVKCKQKKEPTEAEGEE